MCKKLALIFCLLTVLIIGSLVFFFSKTIDFTTIFHSLQLAVPAGLVAYFGGYWLGQILQTAKAETNLIATTTQRQFVDDLLLSPDQVLNTMPILKYNSNSENKDNETKEDESK